MPKTGRGKRYPTPVRKKILLTARRENLTADQVRQRFGVSRVTFYKWRGPVGRGRRPAGPVSSGSIEQEVRGLVRQALPRIIRQEVELALKGFLQKRRT